MHEPKACIAVPGQLILVLHILVLDNPMPLHHDPAAESSRYGLAQDQSAAPGRQQKTSYFASFLIQYVECGYSISLKQDRITV